MRRITEDVNLNLPDSKISSAHVVAEITDRKIELISVSLSIQAASVELLPFLTLSAKSDIKARIRFKYKVHDLPEWPDLPVDYITE